MIPIQNPWRRASLLWATVVSLVTGVVMVNAVQTCVTPNASTITYNLPAGGFSGGIFPVNDRPILVMGTCTTFNFRGGGRVSLLRVAGSFLEWTGMESPNAIV